MFREDTRLVTCGLGSGLIVPSPIAAASFTSRVNRWAVLLDAGGGLLDEMGLRG
jgi:hypothetical protein